MTKNSASVTEIRHCVTRYSVTASRAHALSPRECHGCHGVTDNARDVTDMRDRVSYGIVVADGFGLGRPVRVWPEEHPERRCDCMGGFCGMPDPCPFENQGIAS